MTTHWQEGDVLVSRSYNGLDCTPFDLLDANLMDDNGYYDVIIYFPATSGKHALMKTSSWS